MASPLPSGNWSDLRVRVLSGVLMAGVGLIDIWAGGGWFVMLAVFVTAVMIWEIRTMISPNQPTEAMLLAAGAGAVIAGLVTRTSDWTLLALLVIPLIGAMRLTRNRAEFAIYTLAVQTGGWALIHFRLDLGLGWLMWMVLVVVATDTAGYFAGKTIGGAKFWPAISPKKTWSGTIGGWVAAAVVGLCFLIWAGWGWLVMPLSVAVAFASQMGDIAQSALKRRLGVKDSSTLIPGHGGVYDRFDGLVGAALFLLLAEWAAVGLGLGG